MTAPIVPAKSDIEGGIMMDGYRPSIPWIAIVSTADPSEAKQRNASVRGTSSGSSVRQHASKEPSALFVDSIDQRFDLGRTRTGSRSPFNNAADGSTPVAVEISSGGVEVFLRENEINM